MEEASTVLNGFSDCLLKTFPVPFMQLFSDDKILTLVSTLIYSMIPLTMSIVLMGSFCLNKSA